MKLFRSQSRGTRMNRAALERSASGRPSRALALGLTLALAGAAQAQRSFPDGITLSGSYVRTQGLLDLAAWSSGAISDAAVRGMGVSLGQLGGLNPVTGLALTDTNNLVPLAVRWLASDTLQPWTSGASLRFLNSAGTTVLTLTDAGVLQNSGGSAFLSQSRTISTTAPLSGGGDLSANRTLSIAQASGAADGYLASADWTTFNGKESALTFSSPLSRSLNTISVPVATTSANGYLASTDWTIFNNKVSTTRNISTTAPLSGGGTLAGDLTLSLPVATSSANGYLASADWTTFNNKVGGSGTSGYVPKFTASGTVGNSALFSDASGKVGIGTATPANALEVAGTVKATAFSGDGAALTGIPATALVAAPPGMVLIPAGAFTMGNAMAADTDITDAVPVAATVSAFYMDVNLVSLSQWQSVYYWATEHSYTFVNAGAGKGPNHPVQTVDWYDTVKWCNARSQLAGRTPVYYTDAGFTTVYTTGEVTVYANWAAKGYRLPTEAEQEKAARGVLSGHRFPWGNVINQNLANYTGNTSSYSYDLGPNGLNPTGSVGGTSPATSPVGSFAANGYGLNDMIGNVWQWCWDWYGTSYAGGADPRGAPSGSTRLVRGGAWDNEALHCRAALRFHADPNWGGNGLGFRAVLPPGQ